MLELSDKMPANNKHALHQLQIKLAQTEALVPLTLLGLLTGLLAGGLLIAFRETVSLVSNSVLPVGEGRFEIMDSVNRLFLPVIGAVLLAGLFKSNPAHRRQFGIAHVIERLTFNRGRISLTSVTTQFVGALIALVSGFSVGREGPAVHMGAGAGSFLGSRLNLPDNTLNTLAGCGTAAAISASFNTPMAGVIFAMEVVMKEYALNRFIPVMAASVCAAVMSQAMYGPEPAFQIPLIPMASLTELIISATSAVLIGALAAAFIKLNLFAARQRKGHTARPLLIAGLLMGVTGFLIPEAMGMGYDSIGVILLNGGSLDMGFLIVLLACKVLMTATVTGLGVPGGIIGPSLVIGAIAGTLLGMIGDNLSGLTVTNVSFHALVGMVAMMAAVLQAPLAALVTVLEMTHNPHIIMPAMFTIIIACLTSSQLFGQRGLFDMQFKTRGKQADLPPLTQHLHQTGVACLMDTRFMEHSSIQSVHTISMQATLNDALQLMNKESVDVLPVLTISKNLDENHKNLCGVITREAIEAFYKPS